MKTSAKTKENIESQFELLADELDYYLIADVFEKVKQGKEKIFSSDQIRKELGLLD